MLHGLSELQDNYEYSSHIFSDMECHSQLHGCYELIYTMEGYVKVTLQGKDEFLSQGELMLISPYCLHSFSVDMASKTWIGLFTADFVASFYQKHINSCFSKFTCDPQIEKMLNKYLFVDEIPEHYMLTSCLYMICSECEKNADEIKADILSTFKKDTLRYISNNICKDVTMKDMALEFGYEYHYLSALFNEAFGMNFKEFINIVRYNKACRALLDKNKDMVAICDECGFGSVRNLNRVFKKMSGITPREYRTQK